MPGQQQSSSEEERQVRETARKLFSSLFFGWSPHDAGSVESSTPGSISNVSPQLRTQNRQPHRHHEPKNQTEDATAGLQKQVAEQIDKLFPKDSKQLRETPIFKEAYKAIQWQRDNYLVGREYANWRTKERLRLFDQNRSISSFQNEIQFDETALAHEQFAKLAASFIPSETVKAAVLPLVTPLFGTSNVLYPTSQQAVIHIIESQQGNLNVILKKQLLLFLENPDNRTSMKSSTKGFISTTYRD